MTRHTPAVSRAPRGVLSDKPVYVRLMPDELARLEHLAGVQNRSKSSLARLILVEGMHAFEQLASVASRARRRRS